ncbi:MAG: endonuclease V, partial [Candidatus Hecatellaceae archaeon]
AQKALAARVRFDGVKPWQVKLIGGVDLSYPQPERARGAAVVLKFEDLSLVEARVAEVKVRFPYVPTLLSFREAPAIFKVLGMLSHKPDIVLVDGQGVAHPYGCGLASHIGVVLNQPTIGVAKKLLCGELTPFKPGLDLIVLEGRRVGAALTVKEGLKPIYVSVGHMVSLEDALEIVRRSIKAGRIPEPLRLAHRLATQGRL